MLPPPAPRARFGAFELDLATGELRRGGRPVRLQPQPSQVLTLLVERAGELVTREELQQRVWGSDTVVAFDQGLNFCIRQVRSTLGDQATSPTYIETVPRRGYRFVAPVALTHEVARDGRMRVGGGSLPWGWALGALALALVGAFALGVRSERAPVGDGSLQAGGGGAPAAAASKRRRLAVLPLVDLSPPREGADVDPYLADSLTEELITHLSRLSPEQMGVISRVSAMTYRGSPKTVAEIGAELRVSHVLEGSVRRAGDRLRVTVQLIQVSDQTQLWAQTYEREVSDILDIESDIARRVTRALSLRLLSEEALVRRVTARPEAYEAYLAGRYQWNRFEAAGYLAAVEHFRHALDHDPELAEAWAALADAYNLLAFTSAFPEREAFDRAREAARQALALDPDLAEGHNSLAFVLLYGDWRPQAALEEFERAVELAPGYAMAHHWAAGAYAAVGRFGDAVASAQRALELDPVSLSVRGDLGWYHLAAGDWRQALEQCEAALELSSGYAFALDCRRRALAGLGDQQAELEALREQLAAGGVGEEPLAAVFRGASGATVRVAALQLRRQVWVEREARGEVLDPLGMAWIHAEAGALDDAFAALERAVERRDPWLVFLWADRRFEPLWEDPRCDEVGTRVGLARPVARRARSSPS